MRKRHWVYIKKGCEKTKAGSGNDKDEFYKIKEKTFSLKTKTMTHLIVCSSENVGYRASVLGIFLTET